MKRTQIEIIIGIIVVFLTSVVIIVYGLNEETRMEEYTLGAEAREIERGAYLFETYCSRCHGVQGLGILGLCPPLNDRYFFDERLNDIGWSGSLDDYIVATVSGGRVISTRPQQYPGQGTPAMPSFSSEYGGPLREDEIRSIAYFIENWEPAAQMIAPPPALEGPPVGSDITKTLPSGDPEKGKELAASLACTACHILAPTGPAWEATAEVPGVGTRAGERYEYTGKATSAEQYLFESIVDPNGYLVSGFAAGVMPQGYATQLTDQDMADLIAYLLTFK